MLDHGAWEVREVQEITGLGDGVDVVAVEPEVVLFGGLVNFEALDSGLHGDVEDILPPYALVYEWLTDEVSDLETVALVEDDGDDGEMLISDLHVICEALGVRRV